ncbi:MAG: hypothetical protein H8E46_12000 [FCB group bacterium]|nr:hypothetical protein [FCB group bacterium]
MEQISNGAECGDSAPQLLVKAREQFVKAEGLVEATGYHRRGRDINEPRGNFTDV